MHKTWFRSGLGAALVAAGMFVGSVGGASAAGFTVSGTVMGADEGKQTLVVLTSDVMGKAQPITIDMSGMPELLAASTVGSSISLQIEARESDTYLALGSGSDERFFDRETQGDSIRAHVGNVPDDDEALTQQHRDRDLRRHSDDNSSNGGGSGGGD